MTKCEHCRWDIPENASSCPYCGHLLHLDVDTEQEKRKRLLHSHMLNMMSEKRRFAAPGTLYAVAVLLHVIKIASIVVSVTLVTVTILASVVIVRGETRGSVSSSGGYVGLPGGKGSPGTSGTTGVGSSSSTCIGGTQPVHAQFTFSGPMTVSHACITIAANQFSLDAVGTTTSRTCSIFIYIDPYTSPGTYNTQDNSNMVSLNCDDGTYWFSQGGAGAGVVSVRRNGQSGTVNSTLQVGGIGTAQFTGSWTPV